MYRIISRATEIPRERERAKIVYLGEQNSGKIVLVHKYQILGRNKDGAKPFSVISSDRTRRSGHKLKFQLNLRRNVLTVMVIKRSIILSPKGCELSVFGVKIQKVALSNVLQAGVWDKAISRGTAQPQLFWESALGMEKVLQNSEGVTS